MSSVRVSGRKSLVLILLDTMYFVIASSIVFFLLMRANIRNPYRMGLKTLEHHHALLAELKFCQHVGCLNIVAWIVNYFGSVLIVIQILY